MVASAQQQSGLPDVIGVRNGAFFGMEVKVIDTKRWPTEPPWTPKQFYTLEKVAIAGGLALCLMYKWQSQLWQVVRVLPPNNPHEGHYLKQFEVVLTDVDKDRIGQAVLTLNVA